MNTDPSIVICCNGKDSYSAHRTAYGQGETAEKAVADLKRKERMAGEAAKREEAQADG